ncbi:4-hydroxythreonine-4-phosphate dehydrogenase PdxA [Streptomyces viridiviolaceus]|uniref:4-hydroxythreonine-4-phosphate dehydrogenase PdxA n=1 Tax=Streptomyces viridiviolaceus TaxID=68282 RepID=A0ABW2E5B3_9ACTN
MRCSGDCRSPSCAPAHGTAFDIVGKGIANTGSIQKAIDLAVRIGGRSDERVSLSVSLKGARREASGCCPSPAPFLVPSCGPTWQPPGSSRR